MASMPSRAWNRGSGQYRPMQSRVWAGVVASVMRTPFERGDTQPPWLVFPVSAVRTPAGRDQRRAAGGDSALDVPPGEGSGPAGFRRRGAKPSDAREHDGAASPCAQGERPEVDTSP